MKNESGLLDGYAQLHARLFLQRIHDPEKILRARIAAPQACSGRQPHFRGHNVPPHRDPLVGATLDQAELDQT